MADLLSRLQEERTLADNVNLAQAAKDMQWAKSFSSTPPTEVLRSRVNYEDALARATTNALNLRALSDEKAARIIEGQQRMRQRDELHPLKMERLQKQIDAEGAHERFLEQKDAEAMRDAAGFFDAIGKITAKQGTPEYRAGLNAALQANPRFTTTQIGADAWKKLNQEHQDIAAITPPPGMEVDRIDIGDDGKAKAVFKPATAPSGVAVPEGMVPSGARVNKRGDVSVNYSVPKDADPLKKATALRGQMKTLEQQARTHDKTVRDIEKEAPAFLNTTGIFTDKNGARRYGRADTRAEESPLVTEADEEKFQRYQTAKKAREEIEARLPQLNQQLDDILTGEAAPAPVTNPAAPASSPTGPSPSLKPMDDAIVKSARAAIAAGKDAEAVKKRLQESGYDASGL